jgi:hypothetical protein
MELLIKKSPNFTIISESDKKFYKQILDDSNAIYKGFNSQSKRLNSDSSNKWEFIKNDLFSIAKQQFDSTNDEDNLETSILINEKNGSSIGQKVELLPSNPNSLLEMLQLSIASYQAGNKNEYNKINCILDELLKLKKIKKRELKTIYKSIGF